MKKSLAIVLMLCIWSQAVFQLLYLSWFKINQSYIAANLCINRAQANSTCCGKCVLYKSIIKVDQQQHSNPNNTSGQLSLDFGLDHFYLVPELNLQNTILSSPFTKHYFPHIRLLHNSLLTHKAIKPPPAIAV